MDKWFNSREWEEGKELAKEFADCGLVHKLTVIQIGLILLHKTIYDNPILKKYKGLKATSPKEKSRMVVEDLYNKEDLMEQVYELCWESVKTDLP